MRKYVVFMLTAAVVFLMLASCRAVVEDVLPPVDESPPGQTAGAPETPQPLPAEAPPLSAETPPSLSIQGLAWLWERIDGSTVTIPLTAALQSALGDGENPPVHNTTSSAYDNLINRRDTDLIFVTYPSEYEFEKASENGVVLEIIPILKDALVFLVNIENKVDDVTLSQLQDVYSGNIRNWKALGGPDETIIAYQRTLNSGSQTLMMELVMNESRPMDPPTEWVIGEMSRLVEVVSGYDNSRSAIGYSMFYYVNNMYGNSWFKLLGIDGVMPSRDTIMNGEYPLEDYYYAVLRKDTPQYHPARKLVDWLLTDEGQALAASAGYIPLRPVESALYGSEIDPIYLGDTGNSSGTGGTVLKADMADVQPANGVRPPLSDLFFDGYNYIRYINSKIMEEIEREDPDEWPSRTWGDIYLTRPFTGIPNDYPNYEVRDTGDLVIMFPDTNPFFYYGRYFFIPLTNDISPYGKEPGEYNYKIGNTGGETNVPGVGIERVGVSFKNKPDVSMRINEQLEAWTVALPGNGAPAQLFYSYFKWLTGVDADNWDYSKNDGPAFSLAPSVGIWGEYFSVSYLLHAGEFGSQCAPMFSTICFNKYTGDVVDLAGGLPVNLDYSRSIAYEVVDFDAPESQKWPRNEKIERQGLEGYTPAAGSVITDAWVYGALNIRLTEPDGRRLQICFMADAD